ncbi:MAG: SAVED domain-containing protein [Myxococcales bacterium]|nr:SAVED domain-containing protein [Myxococcales bacterium]
MDSQQPVGLILLAHAEQVAITDREMTAALPPEWLSLPRTSVELDILAEARKAISTGDWNAVQRRQEALFRERLVPVMDKHSDHTVVYFGSAPVPLAIHLGALLSTWRQVTLIPHHHVRRSWGWFPHEPGHEPEVVCAGMPDYKDRSPGEAVIRVSTSHPVDALLTRRVVSSPLLEIDIGLRTPREDAFATLAEMQEVAAEFRSALNWIGDHFAGISRIHLFASVQPGVAMLLGAQISSTMHRPVQTYQYACQADPPHLRAVRVNTKLPPELPPLTEGQKSVAVEDRRNLARDLERIKGFAQREQATGQTKWLSSVLSSKDQRDCFGGTWHHLPALCRISLATTSIDTELQDVLDSFRLHNGRWQLDDYWLANLAKRVPDQNQRQRSLRMLLLHEGVHRGPQGITRTTSQEVGRFPKVLEEVDYQADVWAFLYERVLSELELPSSVTPPRRFFMDAIRTATETMWAFDMDAAPLQEIQVRRLNRYLIWYWQYLRMEKGIERPAEMTLPEVINILAERPHLELAGPHLFTRDERVFFSLDPSQMRTPELAIYHCGKFHRDGARDDFRLSELLSAFAERDTDRILAVLRAAVDMTVR